MSIRPNERILTPRDEWAIETIARQIAVLDAREREVRDMSDSVARCAGWLALGRQAPSYVRYLRPWMAGVGFDVIASTLARLLARRGRNVLAADLDTNPGLAMSLGMPRTDAGLSAKAVEEHPGANYGWQLASGLTPPDAVARFSTRGPDGVHFLGVGKITSPNKSAAMQSVAAIVQILGRGFARLGCDRRPRGRSHHTVRALSRLCQRRDGGCGAGLAVGHDGASPSSHGGRLQRHHRRKSVPRRGERPDPAPGAGRGNGCGSRRRPQPESRYLARRVSPHRRVDEADPERPLGQRTYPKRPPAVRGGTDGPLWRRRRVSAA